jgi:hypothetical protein
VKRLALIVLATGLAFMSVGCKPEVTKGLLFVNDSVTNGAAEEIITRFNAKKEADPEGRYAPNFGSSEPGAGLLSIPFLPPERVDEWWTTHLASVLQHVNPEVVIVELGYNDCGQLAAAVDPAATYAAAIDRFMGNLPPDKPVHWVTMQDAQNLSTCDETVNAALNDAVARWTNLSIFDFGAFMVGHPEWTNDGIHLSGLGQFAYAGFLQGELDAIYLQTNPPPTG